MNMTKNNETGKYGATCSPGDNQAYLDKCRMKFLLKNDRIFFADEELTLVSKNI